MTGDPLLASEIEVPSLLERYLAAQLAGDRRRAVRVLVEEGLGQGLPEMEVRNVIREAQIRVGELWEAGRITVAEEHMATAVSQLALSYLYSLSSPHSARGLRVLVACVTGDLHDFASRLASDALDLAGFEVKFLGAGVDIAALLAATERFDPKLVALTITMRDFEPGLLETVAAIREAAPELPIFVGGRVGLEVTAAVDFQGSTAEDLLAAALPLASDVGEARA